ncbi:ABC transporter substrate-binding protein [Paracoccus aerodenitrificans]|uniref:ABC transporter substrate-binding protein n=1 Tax=Paracoccus aerodenitrificans TaxID=3017781 RepID=UPI0022F06B3B|nr:ABC transporter substrate-binding protein [Paracoccus aerodenitrificans]WBU64129.1 ABC transporter substrate-binding protein [Paracoccus aerodenitrificans]
MPRNITAILLTSSLLAGPVLADDVTLTIESWRNDDMVIWQQQIIPAFEAAHPGIKVKFDPTAPTKYNAALNSKLDGGTAGDLIACRPFDASLSLFEKGKLADLTGMEALSDFPDRALAAWSTDDGSKTFCVPMAAAIHGFIYNKDIFDELGLEEPETEEEFFALLETIKEDGNYIPLALGTADQWESSTMGLQNIGPTYWKGEEGRQALISGEGKLTDEGWVKAFRALSRWGDYLGDGYESQTYPDSQNLFTLGRAAIFPAGSWEISGFNQQADFELGAFRPPVENEGDTCYISDHTDIGMGMNAAAQHPEEARIFLEWLGTEEFANLYSNALPGFYSLSKHPLEVQDPLAAEFLSWRQDCESTIRSFFQILSRGTPNLENEAWGGAVSAIKGTATPEEITAKLQQGLESWYAPQAPN